MGTYVCGGKKNTFSFVGVTVTVWSSFHHTQEWTNEQLSLFQTFDTMTLALSAVCVVDKRSGVFHGNTLFSVIRVWFHLLCCRSKVDRRSPYLTIPSVSHLPS